MSKPAGSLRSQAIVQVLQEANKPLTLDELLQAARAHFPFDVKALKATLSSHASSYAPNSRLIQHTADDRYVWLPNLVQGVTFRHSIPAEELKRHHLLLESEIITALWPNISPWGRAEDALPWRCDLPDGTSTAMKPERLGQRGWSVAWGIRGDAALWAWLESQHAAAGDALLLQIEQAATYRCSTTFEPASQRNEERIAERDRVLADAAATALKSRRRGVWLTDIAARMIAFGIYHDPCPPSPLETILKNDSRFMWDNFQVKLATRYDHLSATLGLKEPGIGEVLEDKPSRPTRRRPPRKELANQVYRFHAAFRYNKSLWRRIEIRGDQFLHELDGEMRAAFGHDASDHLSEFYLGTDADSDRRGLGTHNPFGGGEGDEWIVGELGLESGDELSYTYDFGDNIQHILKVEAIVAPEHGLQYPRVVEQNKPRHRNCEDCRESGKKEIATWICINCSNHEQRRVLICEEHLSRHEDHYVEEMLY